MVCGLLGRHLAHSYSPQIHSYLGDYGYEIYEREPDNVGEFLLNGNFTGINVTIPYKKTVIPYLDGLTPVAARLGSVNTIVKRDDNLIGHNTDYFGFYAMVMKSGVNVFGKKVLVLGSGGASNTVTAVLSELGANTVVISRSGDNHYGNLQLHKDAAVIVNTTPVGMYPNTGVSPLDLDNFPTLEAVLDLIYNPARTKLLLDAQARGLITENGLWMLIAQAKESAEWFKNEKIDDSVIPSIHQKLRSQIENIVLIGMPGCGKSTVADLLCKELHRIAVDADSEIEKEAGCTIPEIFNKFGEETFRTIESRVLERLGKESGLIIATGGGCVTKRENYHYLHQNGKIFWLERDISLLPTAGRPLSQKYGLAEIYSQRKPMYDFFADYTVDNNNTPQEASRTIRSLL